LGGKVTLVEGELTERGSEGPLKLLTWKGSIISASGLSFEEGGDINLVPPLTIKDDSGHVLLMNGGVMTMTKEGVFKSLGLVELRGEADDVQEQQSEHEQPASDPP
jgi:hypothetical protein